MLFWLMYQTHTARTAPICFACRMLHLVPFLTDASRMSVLYVYVRNSFHTIDRLFLKYSVVTRIIHYHFVVNSHME